MIMHVWKKISVQHLSALVVGKFATSLRVASSIAKNWTAIWLLLLNFDPPKYPIFRQRPAPSSRRSFTMLVTSSDTQTRLQYRPNGYDGREEFDDDGRRSTHVQRRQNDRHQQCRRFDAILCAAASIGVGNWTTVDGLNWRKQQLMQNNIRIDNCAETECYYKI